jgi:hypothetical protein
VNPLWYGAASLRFLSQAGKLEGLLLSDTPFSIISESDSPSNPAEVQSESEVSDAWVAPMEVDEPDPIQHRSRASISEPVPRARPEW